MKKTLILVILFLISLIPLKSQPLPEISDSAEFYLLTCEPGQLSYEKFGHTGIRVVDGDIDITINWGVFSFDEPNFILKFVRGETDYMVDVWSTEGFLREYQERGSVVYQNHLNFCTYEKRQLWERIQNNFLPENRKYRYNFIFDNCATRAYTMIMYSAKDSKIEFQSDDICTYRELVNMYAKPDTWLSLGINFVFGCDADMPITLYNTTTFPIQAMQVLSYTTMMNDTVRVPVVDKATILFNSNNLFRDQETNDFIVFLMFLFPILLLGLFILMYARNRHHYWVIPTQIVLWLTTLFSLLLIFLMFCTSHPLVQRNLNILWCSPLNGVLAAILLLHGHKKLKCQLAAASAILSFVFIFIFAIGIQGSTPPLLAITIFVFGVQALVLVTYLRTYEKFKFIRIRSSKHHHHEHHHHHHHHHHHKHETNK